MKREKFKLFGIGTSLLALFIIWTLAVKFIDVEAIGPQGSSVGFAKVNQFFHRLTGVHMSLYTLTDWLSLIPLGIIFGFALLGAAQLIKRKNLFKVDFSILALGVFYVAVMTVFVLFEVIAVNYRPILINGCLEASYPSSTTMLVMCVMPTAMIQLHGRIKNNALNNCVMTLSGIFTAFMVVGRIISGVHWITDIVGGALLSAGIVLIYIGVCRMKAD